MDVEEAQLIKKWLSNHHNKKILDVGSGNPKVPSRPHRWNILYKPILNNGNVIHSLDKTKFKDGCTPYPQIVADAEDMSMIERKTYDFVLCTSCIEHLQCPSKTLAEVHRVLKDEGRAFVSVPGSFPRHGGYDNNIRIQSEEEWRMFLDDEQVLDHAWVICKFIRGEWYVNASKQRGWQSMVILKKDLSDDTINE